MTQSATEFAPAESQFHTWMPDYTPPWELGDYPVPRPEYQDGLWAYAVGRQACDHRDYEDACATAMDDGWNPWWIRSWADVEAVLQGCWFCEESGAKVCRFLEKLTLSKGQWRQRTMTLMDWQRYDLVMPLYGWRAADDTRRYTQGGIWIPKKNGKSGLCSGLGLYHLRGDGEGAPYVWCGAGDRKQAGIIHDESARMVKRTPGLARDLKCIDSQKRITYPARDGVFEALSADAELKEGLDWSAGIFDELHVGMRKMWTTLEGGGAARTQPMMISISTAGVYDVTGIGWEQWDYSQRVAEGSQTDTSYFSLMYYASQDDQWDDWDVLKRANPSLGITCQTRFIEQRIRGAKLSPRKLGDFLRYHLNIWTAASTRAFPYKIWTRCQTETDYKDYCDSLLGQPCWGGMDLSLTDDLTAVARWFKPCDKFDRPRFHVTYFLPEENIVELEQANRAPYAMWAEQGYITLLPGNVVDYAEVKDVIESLHSVTPFRELAYDPYRALSLVQDLQALDIPVVEQPQWLSKMGPLTEQFDRLMRTRGIEHPNCPVTNWMIGNCQAVHNRDGIWAIAKADKTVRFKVDGIIATIMACGRALVGENVKPSVYESRGLFGAGGETEPSKEGEAETVTLIRFNEKPRCLECGNERLTVKGIDGPMRELKCRECGREFKVIIQGAPA